MIWLTPALLLAALLEASESEPVSAVFSVEGGRPVWRVSVRALGGPVPGHLGVVLFDALTGAELSRHGFGQLGDPDPIQLERVRVWAKQGRRGDLSGLPIDWTQPLYLRFGAIGQASGCWLRLDDAEEKHAQIGDFERRGEAGTSVYQVSPSPDGGWEFHRLNKSEAIYGIPLDYWEQMLGRFAQEGRPAHLVQGPRVGAGVHIDEYDGTEYPMYAWGADGEPLLEPSTVRVVSTLPAGAWRKGSMPFGQD